MQCPTARQAFGWSSRGPRRCRQVISNTPKLLGFGPETPYRSGVEQLLAARPIPSERPQAVLALKGLYGLKGSGVGLREIAPDGLEVLCVPVGAGDVDVMAGGLDPMAIVVRTAFFPVAPACELFGFVLPPSSRASSSLSSQSSARVTTSPSTLIIPASSNIGRLRRRMSRALLRWSAPATSCRVRIPPPASRASRMAPRTFPSRFSAGRDSERTP